LINLVVITNKTIDMWWRFNLHLDSNYKIYTLPLTAEVTIDHVLATTNSRE